MRDERRVRPAARRAAVLACVLVAGAGLVAAVRVAARMAASAPRAPQEHFEAPAAATLDPSGVDFDEQVVGRWSRAQRVVVTNTGGAPLHVNSVSVVGDDAGKYSVEKDTCTGAEVVPYRACVIDIAFLPTAKDDFDAELKLTDNAPDSPQTIRLTGEGINSVMVPPGGTGR
ncbi:MAG TPA: choice-of-anchor D domain-containing protein [Pyrinomonadaceae bacterium]|nr:choice-of-anchor D domain-containing protein [Pyrinomonadaceae bacterium]